MAFRVTQWSLCSFIRPFIFSKCFILVRVVVDPGNTERQVGWMGRRSIAEQRVCVAKCIELHSLTRAAQCVWRIKYS